MDKYTKQVYKLLLCSKENKERIINDLKTDIVVALENGESIDDVLRRLGTPSEYVKEFNDTLAVEKKSYKKYIIGLITGTFIAIGLFVGYQYLSTPSIIPIEESKIFRQEDLLKSSQEVIEIINQKEFMKLEDMYSEKMKKAVKNGVLLEDAIDGLGELGNYQKIGEYKFIEYKDSQGTFATGDLVVDYEKRTVIYRLTFDENMKLSGIYMR